MTRVLLATRNGDKLAELRRILALVLPGCQVVGLDDVADYPQVPETGATFAENALLKAQEGFAHTGIPTVADDSGLALDAMGGMPGVLSARWCGRHGDDLANLQLVLAQLTDVPDERRTGAFVCAAALVAAGTQTVVEGRMAGRVIHQPRGRNGFGYDPIFVADGNTVTNAELDPQRKDAISHRGKALRALAPHVASILGRAPSSDGLGGTG